MEPRPTGPLRRAGAGSASSSAARRCVGRAEQRQHRGALVEEQPDIAGRHAVSSARASGAMALSRSPPARWASARSIRTSTTLPSRPLLSAAVRSRSSSAACLVEPRVLGDQQPGEGQVVVLGEVGRVVAGGDAVLAGPGRGDVQASARDVDPGPERGDRAHVGEEAGQVERLGLLEQVGRGVEVAAGLPQPGHGGVPAVPVLEEGAAPRRASRAAWRCSLGSVEVALLTQYVGEADVQVAGRREHDGRVSVGRVQRPLVEPPRLGRVGRAPATCRPARRWRPARRPGSRPRAGCAPPRRTCRPRRRGRRRPRRPGRGTRPPAPRARWSSGPARSRARRACCDRAGDVARGPGRPRRGRPRSPWAAAAAPSSRGPRPVGRRSCAEGVLRRRRSRALRAVQVALGEPAPRGDDAEHRAAAQRRRPAGLRASRAGSGPGAAGGSRAGLARRGRPRARRRRPARACADRRRRHAVLGVPAGPLRGAGPCTRSGCSAGEPCAQRVGEEVVVAVPLPLVVERDDEQVRALEVLEHVAVRRSGR